MIKRILIIESNKQDQENLKRTFLEEDYKNVYTADSGRDGIEAYKKLKPDVVFLNTQLSKDDSFDVCRKIKSVDGLETKVIMITDLVDAVEATKTRSVGADDYCVKTFDCLQLLESIRPQY